MMEKITEDKKRRRQKLLERFVKPYEEELKVLDQTFSFDYIKREQAFSRIKAKQPFATIMQYILMILFVTIDIIPLVFKTFSPKTAYDQIILDTQPVLIQLKSDSRKNFIQNLYDSYHSMRIISNKKVEVTSRRKISLTQLSKIEEDYDISVFTILFGAILGVFVSIIMSVPQLTQIINNENISYNINKVNFYIKEAGFKEIVSWTAISSIVISIIANFLTEILKKIILWTKKSFSYLHKKLIKTI